MRLTREQMLVPLVVSFFMSGINSILGQIYLNEFTLLEFMREWALHWILAYPCLLLIVPLARKIVRKILTEDIQSSSNR